MKEREENSQGRMAVMLNTVVERPAIVVNRVSGALMRLDRRGILWSTSTTPALFINAESAERAIMRSLDYAIKNGIAWDRHDYRVLRVRKVAETVWL